jgi:hypothetical protein
MARSSNIQQDSLDPYAPIDHEFSRQALLVQKLWHGEDDNADDLHYDQTWKFVGREVSFGPNQEVRQKRLIMLLETTIWPIHQAYYRHRLR